MLKKMRELLRDEQGFTLIELMVVIVILGVLAGIGIPTYRGFVERAYKAELEVAQRTLLLALELYRFDHGSYPEPATDNKFPAELHTEGLTGTDGFEKTAYIEKGEWPEEIAVSYYAREGDIKEKPAFTLQGQGNQVIHYNYSPKNQNQENPL